MDIQRFLFRGTVQPGTVTAVTVQRHPSHGGGIYIRPSRPVAKPTPAWFVKTTFTRLNGRRDSDFIAFRQKRHAEMWMTALERTGE